jgi:hypothetical protein
MPSQLYTLQPEVSESGPNVLYFTIQVHNGSSFPSFSLA